MRLRISHSLACLQRRSNGPWAGGCYAWNTQFQSILKSAQSFSLCGTCDLEPVNVWCPLNRSNGESDKCCRYQYLELAFYLSYGRCPAPGDEKYILNQENFDSYNEFYKVSSQALNVRKSTFRSRELCICARLSLSPREIEEQRTYVYEDLKV